MKVKNSMHKGVDWVSPDTPVTELAKLMRDHDVGAIPIGENDRLVGMVTDRDIVCKGLAQDNFDARRATARDVMTAEIHCCREDDDLAKAVRHMEELKVRRLPVINKSKRMIGMLSLGDVSHSAPVDLLSECIKSVSAHQAEGRVMPVARWKTLAGRLPHTSRIMSARGAGHRTSYSPRSFPSTAPRRRDCERQIPTRRHDQGTHEQRPARRPRLASPHSGVVEDQGRIFALDNRCPHMGFPLDRRSIEDGILTCHWHHARFDLASGCTFDLWADDVPTCAVELRVDEVWIQTDFGHSDAAAYWQRQLEQGMAHNLGLVIAKAIQGQLAAGVPPIEIVRQDALFGACNRDGWDTGMTILTALGNLLAILPEEETYLALFHGVRRAT